jgi:hypothetical protein
VGSSFGGFRRPGFARGGFAPPQGGFGFNAVPPAQQGFGFRPRGGFGGFPGGRGGLGGLLGNSTPSQALVRLLKSYASRYEWAAATVGANSAAGVQLATGEPIMAIGGFNGTDPAPTLAQFERYVRQGKIHYFLAGGGGFGGNSRSSSTIASWVASHYTARTVGGVTVYDLG